MTFHFSFLLFYILFDLIIKIFYFIVNCNFFQKGNYFTCDGDKIYYPEHKLQKELDERKITEPFVFVKQIKVVTKS